MSDWLTENDQHRIEKFAQQPSYLRGPDMLVPDDPENQA